MFINRLKKSSLILFTVLAGFLSGSCEFIKFKQKKNEAEEGKIIVARAHDQYLYIDDLDGLVPTGMGELDSLDRIERYIDSWIRKQVLINEATKRINFEEAELERKILEYRYSLIGYEYRTLYINQNLNQEISEEEIQAYYNENKDNFTLRQNIIRGKFINVPVGAPRTNMIKKLLFSEKENDKEELKTYCLSFASAYHLDDSLWVNFEEVIKNTPLAEIPNKVQYLRNNQYVETSDDTHLYYLKIEEYRISDNTSPLEFVKNDIRNILINKRKVELAKKLEEDIYARAIQNNEIEVYEIQ